MKKKSIKSHLNPYSILKKRQTTINHAFASAIAPNDGYDEKIINEALKFLGQNPEKNLSCVYCGEPAETWDHIFGLVKNLKFSGYGHVIGNLLPCCKKCNSEKGNQLWSDFLDKKIKDASIKKERIASIRGYLKKYLPRESSYENIEKTCAQEINKYENIKERIFDSMKEADSLALSIRKKIKDYEESKKS